MPPEPRLNFEIQVPENLDSIYSNFLSVWHSGHEFTLDFGVTALPKPNESGDGVTVPARVVARIKIPPTVVDEMLRALATNVSMRDESLKAQRASDARLQEPPS